MSTPSFLLVPDRYKAAKLYSQLPEDGSGDLVVTRATTAIRTNANGILESVAANVPRLDYPVGGGCPSLLIEPAATNLFLNSEWGGGGTPPTSWATPFITGSATVATSTLNPSVAAYTFVTTNQRAVFSQNISQTSGTVYTHSIYVEAVTGTLAVGNLIGYNFSVAGISTYREDGIIVPESHSVQAGKRYSLTITAPSTTSVQVRIGNGTGANTTATVRLSSPQMETSSVATSYIPTAGTTITRNADVISLTGASALIGQTEGTLYAEVDFRALSQTRRLICISDNSISNRIFIGFEQSNNLRCLVTTAGVNQFASDSLRVDGRYKIAVGYAVNNFALYVNGLQVAVDTLGSVPACNTIFIGKQEDASSNLFLNDRIRAAALYKTRLSNAELAALTTL